MLEGDYSPWDRQEQATDMMDYTLLDANDNQKKVYKGPLGKACFTTYPYKREIQ